MSGVQQTLFLDQALIQLLTGSNRGLKIQSAVVGPGRREAAPPLHRRRPPRRKIEPPSTSSAPTRVGDLAQEFKEREGPNYEP